MNAFLLLLMIILHCTNECRVSSPGGGDAVGLPARLAAVAGVGRVVLQLGEGGGRDPPHAVPLATLLQEHPEVNPPPRTANRHTTKP